MTRIYRSGGSSVRLKTKENDMGTMRKNTYLSVIIGTNGTALFVIGEANRKAESASDRRAMMLDAMIDGGLNPHQVEAAGIISVEEFQKNPKGLYSLMSLIACMAADSEEPDAAVVINGTALGLAEGCDPKDAINALMDKAQMVESGIETSQGHTLQ